MTQVELRAVDVAELASLGPAATLRDADVALLGADVALQMRTLEWSARTSGWASRSGDVETFAITVGGETVGYLGVERVLGAVTIVDVAVVPAARGRGIGSAALEQVLAEADRDGHEVRLTVAADNPAARLYRRLGFVERASDEMNLQMARPAADSRGASG